MEGIKTERKGFVNRKISPRKRFSKNGMGSLSLNRRRHNRNPLSQISLLLGNNNSKSNSSTHQGSCYRNNMKLHPFAVPVIFLLFVLISADAESLQVSNQVIDVAVYIHGDSS